MSDFSRYHRQMLLPGIGAAGQRRLASSHALVVGCGALGTVIVDLLARAGVGAISIVDRDLVEITNLQRQVLFDEQDVERGLPKAEAARRRIQRVNHQVRVTAHVADFNAQSAPAFLPGVDLILDGVDNFETRYLMNDLAVRHGLPYVYGGAVGTTGMSMTILPHPACRAAGADDSSIRWTADQATPCLRCLFPEAPPPGTTPTCDTAGVLASAVVVIAAHQVTQAIKLLTGHVDDVDRRLLSMDLWSNVEQRLDVRGARDTGQCPCCVLGRFEFLEGSRGSATTALCGRDAVQVLPTHGRADGDAGRIDLGRLATHLAPHGPFVSNGLLLRGRLTGERGRDGQPLELTVFPDGRALIKGTTEPSVARAIYARYVGA